MNNKWWELPEMSAMQSADFIDTIRNINKNAVSVVLESININDCCNMGNDKQFVGMLGSNGEFYRFTK